MKRLFGGTAIEAKIHSLHSECKNVQNKKASVMSNWDRLRLFVLLLFQLLSIGEGVADGFAKLDVGVVNGIEGD